MENVPEKVSIALFEAILDFMLSSPTAEQIVEFHLPKNLEDGVHALFEQNNAGNITADEKAELNELLRINHIINMLKIRARHRSQMEMRQ